MNLIEMTDMVPQIQQFKLKSSLFEVKVQLHIEYSRITNQIFFHSFLATVQIFQSWMSDVSSSLCIQTEFTMSVPTSYSKTRSKSVAKWYNGLINKLVKQIILYCWQNGLLSRRDTGQLWHVSLIVLQHSTPQMITDWHIHMVHLLLFFTSESQISYLFT